MKKIYTLELSCRNQLLKYIFYTIYILKFIVLMTFSNKTYCIHDIVLNKLQQI